MKTSMIGLLIVSRSARGVVDRCCATIVGQLRKKIMDTTLEAAKAAFGAGRAVPNAQTIPPTARPALIRINAATGDNLSNRFAKFT
jgi:hypothetical protein